MADPKKDKDITPEELRQNLSNFDPKAFAPGSPDLSGAGGDGHGKGGPPQPEHAEVAQQSQMKEQDRPESRPERDDKLVHVGRGHQTTGRGTYMGNGD